MAFVITKLYTTHEVVYVQILLKLLVLFAEIRVVDKTRTVTDSRTGHGLP